MDAFEQLVRTILEHDNFWITSGYKVKLSREEKKEIGRPSSPRWEIDLLAYKTNERRVYAIECKSFLDSDGVDFQSMQSGSKYSHYYKLFSEPILRKVVLERMLNQLVESGMVTKGTQVTLGLAAGYVYSQNDDRLIREWFSKEGWFYLSPSDIVGRLRELAKTSYFNDIAIIATKLLERNPRDVIKANDVLQPVVVKPKIRTPRDTGKSGDRKF